ncbi:uncharacterized protein V6R79_017165 [Siganus canaliculatus]
MTGELTIKHLTLSDSGFYSAVINNIEVNTVQLQVMTPVPKPLVSTLCDPPKTYCLLTCEGTSSVPESLQYRWKEENDWSHSMKVLKITKENKEPEFSCELKNPVSSSRSDPVQNPFITGNLLWIIAVVLVILLIVIVAVVLYYKRKHICQKGKKTAAEADAEQTPQDGVQRSHRNLWSRLRDLIPRSRTTDPENPADPPVTFRPGEAGDEEEPRESRGECQAHGCVQEDSGAGDEEEPGETTELLSQSGGVQQESRGDGVQQESRGGGVQQKSRGGGVQQESRGGGVQQKSRGGGVQQESRGGGVQQKSRGGGVQQESRGGGVQQESRGGGVQQKSRGGGVQQKSRGGGVQQESRGGGVQQESRGGGVQQKSRGGGVQQKSRGGGVQQESRGGGVQQESRGAGVQQESRGGVNDPPDVSSAVTSSSGSSADVHHDSAQSPGAAGSSASSPDSGDEKPSEKCETPEQDPKPVPEISTDTTAAELLTPPPLTAEGQTSNPWAALYTVSPTTPRPEAKRSAPPSKLSRDLTPSPSTITDAPDEMKKLLSQSGGVQQESRGGGVQQESRGGGVQQESRGGGVQQESRGGGVQQESRGGGVQQESRGGGDQQESRAAGSSASSTDSGDVTGDMESNTQDCAASAESCRDKKPSEKCETPEQDPKPVPEISTDTTAEQLTPPPLTAEGQTSPPWSSLYTFAPTTRSPEAKRSAPPSALSRDLTPSPSTITDAPDAKLTPPTLTAESQTSPPWASLYTVTPTTPSPEAKRSAPPSALSGDLTPSPSTITDAPDGKNRTHRRGTSIPQEETVYVEVDGTAVLHPGSALTGNITKIIWKYKGSEVASWSGKTSHYYGQFKGRCALNTRTGELTINHLTLSDSGRYSVRINHKETNTVQLQVMREAGDEEEPGETTELLSQSGGVQQESRGGGDQQESRGGGDQQESRCGGVQQESRGGVNDPPDVSSAVTSSSGPSADVHHDSAQSPGAAGSSASSPDSGDEGTVYEEVYGTAVLHPGSAHTGKITSILWKHNGSEIASWTGKKSYYYGQFKGRCELNTRTGELTINNLTLSDSGSYSVKINRKETNTVQLQVTNKSSV